MNQAFWIEHVQFRWWLSCTFYLTYIPTLIMTIGWDNWSVIYMHIPPWNKHPPENWMVGIPNVLLGRLLPGSAGLWFLKRWCFFHLIINHWITETLLVFQEDLQIFLCFNKGGSNNADLPARRYPSFPLGLSEDVYIMYMMRFDPHEIYTYMYSVYEEMYV